MWRELDRQTKRKALLEREALERERKQLRLMEAMATALRRADERDAQGEAREETMVRLTVASVLVGALALVVAVVAIFVA